MLQFEKAISERDERALEKLLIHEDQTAIQPHEIKALSQLVSSIGEVETVALFRPIKTNSYVKPYRVTATSVSVIKKKKNFSYSFHQLKEPLLPGVYPIRVTALSNLFPSQTIVDTPILSPNTLLNIESEMISFKFNPFYESILPFVTIKKENVKTSLTHLILNSPIAIYSQDDVQIEYTFHAPWGNIRSTETNLTSFADLEHISFLTTEQKQQLDTTLKKALLKDDRAFTTTSFKTKIPTIPIMNKDIQRISVTPALNTKNELNGVIVQYEVDDAKKTGLVAHFLFEPSQNQFLLHNLSYYQENHAVFESDEKANQWMRYLTLNPLYLSQENLKALFTVNLQNLLLTTPSTDYSYAFSYAQQRIDSIEVKNAKRVVLNTSYEDDLQLRIDLEKNIDSWMVKKIVKK